MKKALVSFGLTLVLGIIAMSIDANIGFDGNLSIIVAIATMGSLITYFMQEKK